MPNGASIWYAIGCIVTLGGLYFAKLVVLKALIDYENAPTR